MTKINFDSQPIPRYMTDSEQVGPCPCGRDFHPGVLMVRGDTELMRWFHPECLSFLKHEMTEDEVEEMEEWERHHGQLE